MTILGLNVCCIISLVSFAGYSLVNSIPAKAEDVQMRVEFYPQKSPRAGTPVTLLMKGKKYPTNGWFDEMVAGGTAEADERFVIDAVSVYKSGSCEKVRSLWAPDERDRVSGLCSDPQVYAASQAYFRRITGSAFLGKMLYGTYEIFLVQHDIEGYGTQSRVYTLKQVDGKFYFSNDLKEDPVFIYFSNKYVSSIPKKIR